MTETQREYHRAKQIEYKKYSLIEGRLNLTLTLKQAK